MRFINTSFIRYYTLLILAGCPFFSKAQVSPLVEFKDSQILKSFILGVSYYKTTHIIFPSSIKYVDPGSDGIIVDKVDGVDNILRVKANIQGFPETSLSVVTGDGKYYSYIVNYDSNPVQLNISMNGSDFTGIGRKVVLQGDTSGSIITFEDVKMSETEIARLSYNISHESRNVKHIGEEKNNLLFALHGIYIKDNVIFYKTFVKNKSNIIYDVDFVKFYIRDKQIAKRTVIQELEVTPLYVFSSSGNNDAVLGKSEAERVYALQKFTIPDDKFLEVEMFEKGGGRHLKFHITNADIVNAKLIK